jgi:hypothetical protein
MRYLGEMEMRLTKRSTTLAVLTGERPEYESLSATWLMAYYAPSNSIKKVPKPALSEVRGMDEWAGGCH